MPRLHTVVMVPKGAEYQAVEKGYNSIRPALEERQTIEIVSLPVGPIPVQSFLNQWCIDRNLHESEEMLHVILMGLCGSLTPQLSVQDVVVYQKCLNAVEEPLLGLDNTSYDPFLPSDYFSLKDVTPVTGVMCDRVISSATEKKQLAENFAAEVVDMESIAAFDVLQKLNVRYSMVRVVSDDVHHDLPDLNDAFDEAGNIKPWVMARQFLRNPVGALRLIRGSLAALKTLEQVAGQLFASLGATP